MNIPVTEWFPAEVKPVHSGFYDVKDSRHMWFWSGKEWKSSKNGWVCIGQVKKWRGLTSPHPEWKP